MFCVRRHCISLILINSIVLFSKPLQIKAFVKWLNVKFKHVLKVYLNMSRNGHESVSLWIHWSVSLSLLHHIHIDLKSSLLGLDVLVPPAAHSCLIAGALILSSREQTVYKTQHQTSVLQCVYQWQNTGSLWGAKTTKLIFVSVTEIQYKYYFLFLLLQENLSFSMY